MIADARLRPRLERLAEVVRRECHTLQLTDERLFKNRFGLDQARHLEQDQDLSERVEAFASRFGRLQDTLSDKLLPQLLRALGEPTGSVIDNLDRAERLGWIRSVDEWLAMRRLRNQMVHEYLDDLKVLVDALRTSHTFMPHLLASAKAMLSELDRRL